MNAVVGAWDCHGWTWEPTKNGQIEPTRGRSGVELAYGCSRYLTYTPLNTTSLVYLVRGISTWYVLWLVLQNRFTFMTQVHAALIGSKIRYV